MNPIEISFHGDKEAFKNPEFAKAFSKMVKLAYEHESDKNQKKQ